MYSQELAIATCFCTSFICSCNVQYANCLLLLLKVPNVQRASIISRIIVLASATLIDYALCNDLSHPSSDIMRIATLRKI